MQISGYEPSDPLEAPCISQRIEIARSIDGLERLLTPDHTRHIGRIYLERSKGDKQVRRLWAVAREQLGSDRTPTSSAGWGAVLTDDQVEHLRAMLVDIPDEMSREVRQPPRPPLIDGLFVRFTPDVELAEISGHPEYKELKEALSRVAFKIIEAHADQLTVVLPLGLQLLVKAAHVEWVPDHELHRWQLPNALRLKLAELELKVDDASARELESLTRHSDAVDLSLYRGPLKVGDRVQRGPDWKWDDQDGGEGEQGTITNAPDENTWARVEWDAGGSNSYRWGQEDSWDLILVSSPK